MKKVVVLLAASFCLVAGCGKLEQPIKEEEVLNLDPAFRAILEKKNGIDMQVNDLKKQEHAEQQVFDSQTKILYTQRQSGKRHLHEAIRQAKSQLDGERNARRLKLESVNRHIQERNQRRHNINSIIFNTRQLLEKKNTPQEKSRREQELKNNLNEAGKIEEEINKLKEKARLYRAQLQLLKQ